MSNDINIMATKTAITIDSNMGYQNIDIGCRKKSAVSQLWRFLGQPINQRERPQSPGPLLPGGGETGAPPHFGSTLYGTSGRGTMKK